MHNNDTNEDFIVSNVKVEGEEIINENGDVYKILSREFKRSKVRYNVQLKMKKTIGGCNCQDQLVQQAYRRFLESLNPEDQQGFREILTGQPDIDTDLIDANYTNPEIRQKFKQSGISNVKLQLTPKQQTQLVFGKAKRGKNYNMISNEQMRVSEKYFNMRPDDFHNLRNQSLLTQLKQQVEDSDEPYNPQQTPSTGDENIEEINMDDDIEQPVENNMDLIGQARKKKAQKKRKYSQLYYQNIAIAEDDETFLDTGVHNFKFRTFRMRQTLTEEDQQQLELFDDLKHSIISAPLTQEELQGQGRRKFFNQPMNEEPDQDFNEDLPLNADNQQPSTNQPLNPQTEMDTQGERSDDISVMESSTSEGTSDGTSEGTSEYETSDDEDSIIPLEEPPKHEKVYKRLLATEEDEFELI